MQVPSGRSTSSANIRGKQVGKYLPPHRQRTSVARHKTDIGQNQAVRREGEQLVMEVEQLMRRDEEEEADMDWVRKRMQEVRAGGTFLQVQPMQGEGAVFSHKESRGFRIAPGLRGGQL